ncbi:MAG: hypothetical protein IH986_16440 [Planctomycetes bacterium]|nr:hypothetical protein [Planctomycetota bacterium]
MRTVWVRRLIVVLLLGLGAATVRGGGHRDWTVIPLGSFPLQEGSQTLRLARPFDRFGVIDSPVVFMASYDSTQPRRVPVHVRFSVGEQTYPAWRIQRAGELYVIGTAILQRDAGSEKRTLELSVHVENARQGIVLMASGAPDMALIGADVLGPLVDIEQQLARGALREYIHAINNSSGPGLADAKAAFDRLSLDADERLARFARAKRRRIRFAEVEAATPPGFLGHYRVALFAQQCGMFRSARHHYEAALDFDTARPEAWFRLAEVMERCGDPIEDVAAVLERAGNAARVTPNTWDVLVTILRSKEYDEQKDGEPVRTRVEMTHAQVARIKGQWKLVEQMIFGASRGRLKLNTRYFELENETVVPFGLNAGWLYGPTDALVPEAGSVDCVMSFHPRGPSVTGGADCGPNGAAMTDIGPWAGWQVMLHEWNHQFDWTVRTSEAGDGYPITHHSDGCGHAPIPSMGYGHRASMGYYVTPAMYRRLEPADPDPGKGYLHSWHVTDPIEIDYGQDPPEAGAPSAVRRFGPEDVSDRARRLVVSAAGFVNLLKLYAEADVETLPRMITAATTYVWSPRRQEVRVWLGHNDALALWVNGRLVHRGDYKAIAKFSDQNRPNMVATAATLRRGWNRLDVAVEAWPSPFDKGFGFSVRLCDFDNRPIGELREANEREARDVVITPDPLLPRAGRHYRWNDVRDDFYNRLPRLSNAWLQEYTGAERGFGVYGSVGTTAGAHGGYIAIGSQADRSGEMRGGVPLLKLPNKWDRKTYWDRRLNNLLDWNRESVAVYPFKGQRPRAATSGSWRHLLLMRPEAVEAFLTCLRESPAAGNVYATVPLRDRILGYVQVGQTRGEEEGTRVLILAEAVLPDPLPVDEEDLLSAAAR